MMQVTMQVPDELGRKIQPMNAWLPAIIELSLIGFKTLATAAASEVIELLSQNPSPREVIDYHVSEPVQARLQRLLVLNEAGLLSEAEQIELDELQRLEHVMIMLKARIAKQGTCKKP